MGAASRGAAAARRLPFGLWTTADVLLGASRRNLFSGRVHKALSIAASARSFDELYSGYLDQWPIDGPPVLAGAGSVPRFPLDPGFAASDAVKMAYCDALSYLPDDILCKVDRASMAFSLEARVPFLDHRVAEVAARIPMSMKLHGGTGKLILRKLLGRHLPQELFERPKSGFSMPLGDWLRGDLREWAEDLLDRRQMAAEGFFDVPRIQARWRDTLDKRRNAAGSMWAILMFQSWLRTNRAGVSAAERQPRAA